MSALALVCGLLMVTGGVVQAQAPAPMPLPRLKMDGRAQNCPQGMHLRKGRCVPLHIRPRADREKRIRSESPQPHLGVLPPASPRFPKLTGEKREEGVRRPERNRPQIRLPKPPRPAFPSPAGMRPRPKPPQMRMPGNRSSGPVAGGIRPQRLPTQRQPGIRRPASGIPKRPGSAHQPTLPGIPKVPKVPGVPKLPGSKPLPPKPPVPGGIHAGKPIPPRPGMPKPPLPPGIGGIPGGGGVGGVGGMPKPGGMGGRIPKPGMPGGIRIPGGGLQPGGLGGGPLPGDQCRKGFIRIGGHCVPIHKPIPPLPPIQPGGSGQPGGGQPQPGGLQCPQGTIPLLGRCLPIPTPGAACPAGQIRLGGQCVSPPPACPQGQTLIGGRCVDVCPPGWRWDQNRCVRKGHSCPAGTWLSWDGRCLPACPTNAILIGNVCVPLPWTAPSAESCPLPFVRSPLTGECVLPVDVVIVERPAACPRGFVWSKQVRGCVRPRSKVRPRESIAWIQGCLNALGYDAGPEDGIVGPRTRMAWRAFRRDAGLGRGMVPFNDPATLGALYLQCTATQKPTAAALPPERAATGLVYGTVLCATGEVRSALSRLLGRKVPACGGICVPVPAGLAAAQAEAAARQAGFVWCRHCIRVDDRGLICPQSLPATPDGNGPQ